MLLQQIDNTVIIALIGVFGGVLPAVLSYWFTKNKEVDFSIRQEKTERYDDLMKALARMYRVVNSYNGEDESHRKMLYDSIHDYQSAYYRASTFAKDNVLKRCNDLHDEILKDRGEEDDFLGPLTDRIVDIYKAIRKDIYPRAKYYSVNAVWSPAIRA